jgi:hypothetical protein
LSAPSALAEQTVGDAYLSEIAAALSPSSIASSCSALGEPRAHAHRIGRATAHATRLRSPRRAIQDVLALAADFQLLQKQVYPFILEDYREQAHGRFDDLIARLVELDRQLREIAHSLETKSVISGARRDPSSGDRRLLGARRHPRGARDPRRSRFPFVAQRITVFRAIQEALANVREHASATHVLRPGAGAKKCHRASDRRRRDGLRGRARAPKAAQRGRLGLVGIGERVRHGGRHLRASEQARRADDLKITLPRWEPLQRHNRRGGAADSL